MKSDMSRTYKSLSRVASCRPPNRNTCWPSLATPWAARGDGTEPCIAYTMCQLITVHYLL